MLKEIKGNCFILLFSVIFVLVLLYSKFVESYIYEYACNTFIVEYLSVEYLCVCV
jgi:hypothetical protein